MSLALFIFVPFFDESTAFTNTAELVWLFVLTETKDEFVDEVSSILDRSVDRISLLMSVQDAFGRKAIDVATPKYKDTMLGRSFLFRRYEIREGPAEHVSETCVVRLAKDHKDGVTSNVALKFICNRDHFEREILVRLNCQFDDKYVISTVRLHDGDGDKDKMFGDEAEKKGYYRYCLVMPAAERNLGTVIIHEHVAGRDWNKLMFISRQLVEAVEHVHLKGYIHGDLKRKKFHNIYFLSLIQIFLALNIMRMEGTFRLIDFDASVSYREKQYVGAKYSSAYCPPEMLAFVNTDDVSTVCVRTYKTDLRGAPIQNDLPYRLLLAHTSYDMWSLGATLYQVLELILYRCFVISQYVICMISIYFLFC